MDLGVFIFDGLELLKSLGVPEANSTIFSNCNDLMLLVIEEDIQNFDIIMGLYSTNDSQRIRVDKEHLPF